MEPKNIHQTRFHFPLHQHSSSHREAFQRERRVYPDARPWPTPDTASPREGRCVHAQGRGDFATRPPRCVVTCHLPSGERRCSQVFAVHLRGHLSPADIRRPRPPTKTSCRPSEMGAHSGSEWARLADPARVHGGRRTGTPTGPLAFTELAPGGSPHFRPHGHVLPTGHPN